MVDKICVIAAFCVLLLCVTETHGATRPCNQSIPCMNFGRCEGNLSDPDSLFCQCLPGFNGSQCETYVSPCASRPCQNQGLCVNNLHTYQCLCGDTFSGTHCEIEGDPCLSNPCSNGGSCKETTPSGLDDQNTIIDTTTARRIFECSCVDGFTGEYCELAENQCKVVKCENGAFCVDSQNNFTCVCKPGFEGKYCELPRPCSSNPCFNFANCRIVESQPSLYYCACRFPFTGFLCQYLINPCSSNPCGNNGFCFNYMNTTSVENGTNYKCLCDNGYTGAACENAIDYCNIPSPCNGNGKCVNLPHLNEYSCECYEGFTGQRCQIAINPCYSNPCVHHGQCLWERKNNKYQCSCQNGYSGINCETAIDYCNIPSPCNNSGKCVNLPHLNDYRCECFEGFAGLRCQTAVYPCFSNPCGHNGRCVSESEGDTYRCNCQDGYSGKNCETGPTLGGCYPNPCLHNGECIWKQENNDYQCNCLGGYSGRNCETDEIFNRSVAGITIASLILAVVNAIILLILLIALCICKKKEDGQLQKLEDRFMNSQNQFQSKASEILMATQQKQDSQLRIAQSDMGIKQQQFQNQQLQPTIQPIYITDPHQAKQIAPRVEIIEQRTPDVPIPNAIIPQQIQTSASNAHLLSPTRSKYISTRPTRLRGQSGRDVGAYSVDDMIRPVRKSHNFIEPEVEMDRRLYDDGWEDRSSGMGDIVTSAGILNPGFSQGIPLREINRRIETAPAQAITTSGVSPAADLLIELKERISDYEKTISRNNRGLLQDEIMFNEPSSPAVREIKSPYDNISNTIRRLGTKSLPKERVSMYTPL